MVTNSFRVAKYSVTYDPFVLACACAAASSIFFLAPTFSYTVRMVFRYLYQRARSTILLLRLSCFLFLRSRSETDFGFFLLRQPRGCCGGRRMSFITPYLCNLHYWEGN